MVGTHLLLLFRYLHLLSSNLLLESSDCNMNNNRRISPVYIPIVFFKVASHRFRGLSTLLSPSYFSDTRIPGIAIKQLESLLSAFEVDIFHYSF